RLTSPFRRVDRDPQTLLHLVLTYELGQPLRPERKLDRGFVGYDVGCRDLGTHALPGDGRRAKGAAGNRCSRKDTATRPDRSSPRPRAGRKPPDHGAEIGPNSRLARWEENVP